MHTSGWPEVCSYMPSLAIEASQLAKRDMPKWNHPKPCSHRYDATLPSGAMLARLSGTRVGLGESSVPAWSFQSHLYRS